MDLKTNWMNVVNAVPESIQVLIEHAMPDGTIFRDALYFSPAEHAAISPEAIQALAQGRVDDHLKPPSPPDQAPKSVKEQREDCLRSLKDTVNVITSQLQALDAEPGGDLAATAEEAVQG